MAKSSFSLMATFNKIKKIDIKWPTAFLVLAIYINSSVNKIAPVFFFSKYNDMVVTYRKYAEVFPTTYLGLDLDGDTYRIFVGVFEMSTIIGFIISDELRSFGFWILVTSSALESYSLCMLEEEKWHSLVFASVKCCLCIFLASRNWYLKPRKMTGREIAIKNIKKMKAH